MSKMEKKNQKNAKNRASFLPSPVPPLNKGTLNLPKITEHSAERSAEQGMFGLSLDIRVRWKYTNFYLGVKCFDSYSKQWKS